MSLLPELNDIYDCMPLIDPKSDIRDSLPFWWSDYVANSHDQTYGLLCFSKTYSSPLHWGHYASSAMGVALGFSTSHIRWKDPIHVLYRRARPTLTWPAKLTGLRRMTNNHPNKLWNKSTCVEIRGGDSICNPITQLRAARWKVLRKVRRSSARQIIVGPRSPVSAGYLRDFIDYHYRGPGVDLFTSHMHPKRFEIVSAPTYTLEPQRDGTTRTKQPSH